MVSSGPTHVAGDFDPLTLPTSETPRVSIVICAYNHIATTYHCLHAITLARTAIPFEVIVVDDASTDGSSDVLTGVSGLQVLTNIENVGYLRSANRGMSVARGDYTVLLNNDTAVRPGWLDALVTAVDADPAIGAVGAMLVNPDGTVQEAGAIIWSDATGWNYGRGLDVSDVRVSHRRDVDYCSAAALLVRTELLEKLGGFDERFAPAYYEDVDLCFAVHGLGYRVVYEPTAVVVHAEGLSYGADPRPGGKPFQEKNRLLFQQKWATELESQPPMDPGSLGYARDRGLPPRVLVVEVRMPNVTRDAGSVRLMGLLAEMRAAGWQVHFHHVDGIVTEPAASQLAALGVQCLDPATPLDDQLRLIGPAVDVLWLSRPSVAIPMIGHLAQLLPSAAIVYDTVDLQFVREERQAALFPDESPARPRKVGKTLELAIVAAADITIAVSDEEADVLRPLVPEAIVRTIGLVQETAPVGAGRERDGLIFVGGWEHTPNVDAAEVLVGDIMPLLRPAVPGIVLRLVGSHVTPHVRDLARPDVEVLGWLPNLSPALFGAAVFVAPLRYGAGVKGKVVQAMAHGLPVVTTAVGAEGLGLTPGVDVLLAETPGEFVAAIATLHYDPARAARMAAAGRDQVETLFGRTAARRALLPVLDAALSLAGRPLLRAGKQQVRAGSGPR